jgi:hypothetical protein
MRSDMAKVIVERPRHGSSMRGRPCKGRGRERQRQGLENLPRREGIERPYGYSTKNLSADRDLLSGRKAGFSTADEAARRYGAPMYAVAVWPLAKSELRELPVPVSLWR